MTDEGIRTAVELWDALEGRAGLQAAPRRDGTEGFDADLLAALREELGLPSGPIRKGLESGRCSLESLLCAILLVLEPWSRMMRDVLSMLTEAGAASGTSIALHVRLDESRHELRETLEDFSRQARAAEEAVASASGRGWGEIDLWAIAAAGERPSSGDEDPSFSRAPADDLSPPVREWFDVCLEGGRAPCPPLVASGYREFDDAIAEMRRAIDSCLRASRVAGDTRTARYERFHAEPDRDFGDGWHGRALIALDSDFVAGIAMRIFDTIAGRPDWGASTAALIACHLRAELAKAPPTSSLERRTGRLLDLLDLPVWKRRHELYSVWVATLIRKAAGTAAPLGRWTWRPRDGVLAFPFSGAVVAEIASAGGTTYLWAELRRKASGTSRKRRKNVQPDYTMLLGPDREASPACLVVECKQYRRPSASNFTAALEDYSAAHSGAPVALFNYGSAGASATASSDTLSTSRSRSVQAIGMVKPRGAGEAAALAWLEHEIGMLQVFRQILEPEALVPTDRGAAETRCRVELTWTKGGDLDLHLRGDDGDHVYYASRGSLTERPLMTLEDDLLGPGTERALVSGMRRGRCTVTVSVYGDGESARGAATVAIVLGSMRRIFRSPMHGWREWTVCTMDLDLGLIGPHEA